jgi:hypothetical protein
MIYNTGIIISFAIAYLITVRGKLEVERRRVG